MVTEKITQAQAYDIFRLSFPSWDKGTCARHVESMVGLNYGHLAPGGCKVHAERRGAVLKYTVVGYHPEGKDVRELLASITMREHVAKCVTRRTALGILRLGRLAVGYPLPDGSWSTGVEPFTHRQKVRVQIRSRNGRLLYATVEAEVRDDRRTGADGKFEGAYVAHFSPIHL